jgi:7-cyano-7-deazaguanine synthase
MFGVLEDTSKLVFVAPRSQALGCIMKSVVLFSGGIDSTVLAVDERRTVGQGVHLLAIDYGQRHKKELQHASAIAKRLGLHLGVVNLSSLAPLISASSQTNDKIPVPEGHYTDSSMKSTVVPNRNMIMLAIAAGYAINIGATWVSYAAHAGDHAIYPDCRPGFTAAMGAALNLCHYSPLRLGTPFVHMTKAQVVSLGAKLQAPLHLTWSCYMGGALHCGKCGTCVERREAFQLAGVTDPTEYE